MFLHQKVVNANWENIRTDLNDTMRTIKDKYTSCKANELWNIFKVDLIKSIETNIPHKMITYKHTTQDDHDFSWSFSYPL
jgi:predicted alternative tryptophan synthase beta-subunit